MDEVIGYKKEIGIFKKHSNGYYTFELDENEILIFEEINGSIVSMLSASAMDSSPVRAPMIEVCQVLSCSFW